MLKFQIKQHDINRWTTTALVFLFKRSTHKHISWMPEPDKLMQIVIGLGNAQLFLFLCCNLLLGMLAKQLSHLVPKREDRLMAMLDMKF
jgi:hypothetical protein